MKERQHLCAVGKVAELLSDTWTIRIIHELLKSPKRFCELERDLSGISTRTLTNKLYKLENEKLIEKDKDNFYHPTIKGKGLRPIHKAMRTYGEKFLA